MSSDVVPEEQHGRVRRFLGQVGGSIQSIFTKRGIRERWHELVIGVGSAMALVPGLIPPSVDKEGVAVGPHPAAIVLMSIAGAFLIVGALRSMYVQSRREQREEDAEKLQRRIDVLEADDAKRRAAFLLHAEYALRALAESANVYVNHVRVSGYVHNGGGFFVQFARISKNPGLKVKGKGLYPDSEGILSTAWQLGRDACVDIDPAISPSIHETKYGIDAETVEGFTMNSRSLIALRIEDSATDSENPVGVIVLESTQKRGVNRAMLTALAKSNQWAALQLQISSGRSYLPNTSDAAKEGF